MKITLKITDKKNKPFTTEEGEEMDYYWYKGEDKNDVTISFGSRNGQLEIDEKYELVLEKTETKRGFMYRDKTLFVRED